MHIIMVVSFGLVLLALFVVFARKSGRDFRSLLPVYLAVWLVASLVNLWVGVAYAGYTVL